MKPLSLITALALSFLLTACSTHSSSDDLSDEPVKTASNAPVEQQQMNYYSEFSDILLPVELKRVDKESFVYESPQFKTGHLVYEGSVEANSLIDFFLNNMARDGWVNQSALRSEKSILVFEKPNKSALIEVTDGSFKTQVSLVAVEVKTAGDPQVEIIEEDIQVIE